MNRQVAKERILKFKPMQLKIGDRLLFCPDCDYQVVNMARKPECPNCGAHLYLIDINEKTIAEIQGA